MLGAQPSGVIPATRAVVNEPSTFGSELRHPAIFLVTGATCRPARELPEQQLCDEVGGGRRAAPPAGSGYGSRRLDDHEIFSSQSMKEQAAWPDSQLTANRQGNEASRLITPKDKK